MKSFEEYSNSFVHNGMENIVEDACKKCEITVKDVIKEQTNTTFSYLFVSSKYSTYLLDVKTGKQVCSK